MTAAAVAGAQTPSAPQNEFLYFLNQTPNSTNQSFAAYRIDPETGFLSPVSGQPFQFNTGGTPRNCYCSAIPFADPQGRFLFYDFSWIPNTGYGSMRVNPATGALTNDDVLLQGNGQASFYPSTDPYGRFIFGNLFSNGGPNNWLQSFAVGPDGHLTAAPGEPFPFPGQTTFGPPAATANYVYVANYNDGYPPQDSDFYGFTINRTNGALAQSSVTDDGSFSSNQTITPNGRFLYSDQSYTGSDGAGDVEIVGYRINADGSLTQLDQAPQQTLDHPADNMVMSPNGKFLYNMGTGGIRVYDVDPETGYLTLAALYSNYPYSGTAVVDPAVKFVYMPQLTFPTPGTVNYYIEGFKVDPESGQFSPIAGNLTPVPETPLTMTIVRTH